MPPPPPPPDPPDARAFSPTVGTLHSPAGSRPAPVVAPIWLPASSAPLIAIVDHDAITSGCEPVTITVAPVSITNESTEITRTAGAAPSRCGITDDVGDGPGDSVPLVVS